MPTHPPAISITRLSGTAAEIQAVQAVLQAAPGYSFAISGELPLDDAAVTVFESLPPAVHLRDKHVLGIYLDQKMIGLADVVCGYPSRDVAYLGLLLLAETHQRRSFGTLAFHGIKSLAREWHCTRLRLAVVESNSAVVPFWEALGFVPTGERAVFECGGIRSQSVLFEMPLES